MGKIGVQRQWKGLKGLSSPFITRSPWKIPLERKLIIVLSFFIIVSVLFTYLLSNYVFMNIITSLLDSFSVETMQNKTNLLDTNIKQYDLLLRDIMVNQAVRDGLNLKETGTYENAQFADRFASIYSSIAIQLQTSDLFCLLLKSHIDTYYSPRANMLYAGTATNGANIAQYTNALYQLIQANQGKITFLPTDDYLFTPNQPRKMFAIGRLIKEFDGRENGYIIAFIDYDFFDKVLADSSTMQNETFAIFDPSGDIIYSRSNSSADVRYLQRYVGTLPREAHSRLMTYNQALYLVTYYTSSYSGWTLVNMVPMSELYRGMQVNRYLVIVFSILFIILSIIVAIYITFSITHPIKRLIYVMRGISAGDMSLRAEIDEGPEMRELGSYFNAMVEELNQLIAENEQKQKALVKTELSMLQAQINPHFLYNTLNSIRWISIINKQDQIKNMVDSLAKLIMNTFRKSDSEINIEDELNILDSYINLMKVRYTQFNVIVKMEGDIGHLKILKFILQPFIENSILYGFSDIDYLGEIQISFARQDAMLHIDIADNGKGRPEDIFARLAQKKEEYSQFNNIGIPNVEKRIQLHYGDRYGLEVLANEPCGVLIRIKLPLIE
jgi:sensor histidine kinase YesM